MTETSFVIPSNPADQQKLLGFMKEADVQYMKIADAKLQIAAIVDTSAEEFPDIPKKILRKMMVMHHKQNAEELQKSTDEIVTLYETVAGQSHE